MHNDNWPEPSDEELEELKKRLIEEPSSHRLLGADGKPIGTPPSIGLKIVRTGDHMITLLFPDLVRELVISPDMAIKVGKMLKHQGALAKMEARKAKKGGK